ncbi:DNA-binding MarR family transcriptional regulator [Paenibacillus phyllosphaerae]|uniref:DNA-binding MarR family transcriptional regulator n=1 Tax=Paenibacillus phyllosphaerae TaxID=274593 RepID=A0A7W5AXM7_9BACL|nr:MarR family transcriptional regulator [Paenibacillus phyllosphaerae]MBB3110655.1 DNA-binding MarR family transcriptional regulator [Paenibacillus phyllosphaerae]
MADEEHSTADTLFHAFRQLRQVNWRGRVALEGCNPSETMMLFMIRRGIELGATTGMKPSEISQLMRVTQPTVSQMVNLLEARGLVTRTQDPDDRRAVRIMLTEEGRRITEAAQAAMQEGMQRLVEHLTEERAQLLIELLGEVRAYYVANSDEEDRPECKPHPKPFE